jgi:drug/metabolite transporter (DMT)-like permease
VAATLALVAAFLFALAATLQQKGALGLGAISLGSPASLLRLAAQPLWLFGTLALLAGYVFQAAALDRGRLAIIQPLLVATVVFALPLGYFLTDQIVGRREVIGAAVIVLGLALFVVYGDPAGGRDDAPNSEWAVVLTLTVVLCLALLTLARGAEAGRRAALYGTVAGILFGISACLVKPSIEALHVSVETVLSSWELYAMAIAGILAFVLQQVSLSIGQLAATVATVSVANPVVSVLIGIVLFDERLSRPTWHVVVAVVGLALAFVGAVVISAARHGGGPEHVAVGGPAPTGR